MACHLLALPAELREQIYLFCLCPTGTLHLTTTKSKRHATTPVLAPALLATNRQVHGEASDLLLSNEICLILDAHDTSWPVIAENRLSQSTLEKLKHVFFTLDCTSNFRASYEDVDFSALEALVSLKTLRLVVMYDEASGLGDVFGEFNAMIEILSRVPSSTKIRCSVAENSQQAEYVLEAMNKRVTPVSQWSNGNGNLRNVVQQRNIKIVAQNALWSAVEAVDADVRGTKSGNNSDVFAAYHGFSGQSDFAV